jgi:hypothetical protein
MSARVAHILSSLLSKTDNQEVDLLAIHRAEGISRAMLHRALSASIALVAADGRIDRDENRVVSLLFEAAGLDGTETTMLKAELKNPASVTELAKDVSCPFESLFLLQHLLIVGYLNGRLAESEKNFIEALSTQLGVEEKAHRKLEDQVLDILGQRELRLARPGREALWEQVRRRMLARVERAVRNNTEGIWREVRETGELFTLLTRTSRMPLTADEKERVREQLLDIAKTIPALAIFAVPGGGLLLPLLIKHLPIDLRPSNFVDEASFEVDPTEPSED